MTLRDGLSIIYHPLQTFLNISSIFALEQQNFGGKSHSHLEKGSLMLSGHKVKSDIFPDREVRIYAH